eukprot:TRINITY_DN24351_c0_g1_i1.p1 TRINITY_DN24351_c0_g1~~TRINITY_DN24351_c0_g1_i1.p1  ORF type:complete len:939 (+),score=287.22 TRINITY_DN24351_c0_g1_i1:588-3404(+)
MVEAAHQKDKEAQLAQDKLEQEVVGLQEEVSANAVRREELEAATKALEGARAEAEQFKGEYQQAVQLAEEKVKDTQQAKDALEQEIARIQADSDTQLSQSDQALEAADQKAAEMQSHIGDLNKELFQAQVDAMKLQRKYVESSMNAEQKAADVQDARGKLQDVTQRLQAMEAETAWVREVPGPLLDEDDVLASPMSKRQLLRELEQRNEDLQSSQLELLKVKGQAKATERDKVKGEEELRGEISAREQMLSDVVAAKQRLVDEARSRDLLLEQEQREKEEALEMIKKERTALKFKEAEEHRVAAQMAAKEKALARAKREQHKLMQRAAMQKQMQAERERELAKETIARDLFSELELMDEVDRQEQGLHDNFMELHGKLMDVESERRKLEERSLEQQTLLKRQQRKHEEDFASAQSVKAARSKAMDELRETLGQKDAELRRLEEERRALLDAAEESKESQDALLQENNAKISAMSGMAEELRDEICRMAGDKSKAEEEVNALRAQLARVNDQMQQMRDEIAKKEADAAARNSALLLMDCWLLRDGQRSALVVWQSATAQSPSRKGWRDTQICRDVEFDETDLLDALAQMRQQGSPVHPLPAHERSLEDLELELLGGRPEPPQMKPYLPLTPSPQQSQSPGQSFSFAPASGSPHAEWVEVDTQQHRGRRAWAERRCAQAMTRGLSATVRGAVAVKHELEERLSEQRLAAEHDSPKEIARRVREQLGNHRHEAPESEGGQLQKLRRELAEKDRALAALHSERQQWVSRASEQSHEKDEALQLAEVAVRALETSDGSGKGVPGNRRQPRVQEQARSPSSDDSHQPGSSRKGSPPASEWTAHPSPKPGHRRRRYVAVHTPDGTVLQLMSPQEAAETAQNPPRIAEVDSSSEWKPALPFRASMQKPQRRIRSLTHTSSRSRSGSLERPRTDRWGMPFAPTELPV